MGVCVCIYVRARCVLCVLMYSYVPLMHLYAFHMCGMRVLCICGCFRRVLCVLALHLRVLFMIVRCSYTRVGCSCIALQLGSMWWLSQEPFPVWCVCVCVCLFVCCIYACIYMYIYIYTLSFQKHRSRINQLKARKLHICLHNMCTKHTRRNTQT